MYARHHTNTLPTQLHYPHHILPTAQMRSFRHRTWKSWSKCPLGNGRSEMWPSVLWLHRFLPTRRRGKLTLCYWENQMLQFFDSHHAYWHLKCTQLLVQKYDYLWEFFSMEITIQVWWCLCILSLAKKIKIKQIKDMHTNNPPQQ